MQGITEQDLLEVLFASMPQAQDRPPGAYLSDEIYEQGKALGGNHYIGKNKLMKWLRAGIQKGILEMVQVKEPNICGVICTKPMYRLKNSPSSPKVV